MAFNVLPFGSNVTVYFIASHLAYIVFTTVSSTIVSSVTFSSLLSTFVYQPKNIYPSLSGVGNTPILSPFSYSLVSYFMLSSPVTKDTTTPFTLQSSILIFSLTTDPYASTITQNES